MRWPRSPGAHEFPSPDTPPPPRPQNRHKEPLMEASAQPAKTAYEYFTVGNQAFKDSLERSLAAMSEMNAYSKKNLEALIASATAAAKGVETVGARAIAFSKKSVEGQIA